MNMKRILIVIALAAVFSSIAVAAEETRFTVPVIDSPVLGPADARITMVEFLDFQ